MSDILKDLYQIVEQRKADREEGSYTAYLFENGRAKFLMNGAE
jgi:phosphoribosyl-ATP pyrophosphohydrolase